MPSRQEAEQQIIMKSLEDASFRQQLKANPKAVLSQELGGQLPADVTIEVLEETPNKLYLVLPPMPVEEELSDEQLEAVAGGGCWIGASGGCIFVTRS